MGVCVCVCGEDGCHPVPPGTRHTLTPTPLIALHVHAPPPAQMKRDQEVTRRVSRRHGEDMARKLGLAYFESSAARPGEGVAGGLGDKEVEAPFAWIANACKAEQSK